MDAYPSLGQTMGSEPEIVDDVRIERATNGTLRGRALWPAQKRRFRIEHNGVAPAERDAVLSFYATHRATTFEFTWAGDGQVYVVVFARTPQHRPIGGLLWRVTCDLVEA